MTKKAMQRIIKRLHRQRKRVGKLIESIKEAEIKLQAYFQSNGTGVVAGEGCLAKMEKGEIVTEEMPLIDPNQIKFSFCKEKE